MLPSADYYSRREVMSQVGPVYPAQIAVSQTEIKLVADKTADATSITIKSDQQHVEAAQEVEAAEAKDDLSNVDVVA
jgi:hypothetical protein